MMEIFLKKGFTVDELFTNHSGKKGLIEKKEFKHMAEIYL